MTLLAEIAAVSARVSSTASRLAKVRELAASLRRLMPEEIETAISFLSGETRQGKLGVSYATLHAAASSPVPAAATLTLQEVDAAFVALAGTRGKGSAASRARQLAALFSRATADEQDFLVRLIVGELRQGALGALVLEGIAQAASLPVDQVRRAAMSAGGLAAVGHAALTEGAGGLARFSIQLMRPVLPMLSQSAPDIGAALQQLGIAAFEWKLDGARIQAHKEGEDVRIYTRNLNDVSARVPEIVELVRTSPRRSLILDGEAIALRADETPLSFQLTMRRFGRKLEVDAMRRELPLSAFFFDCLLCDGVSLADEPATDRFRALEASLPAGVIIPRLVTDDADVATRFMTAALERGHEGVMAKALDAPYEAGRRGAGWLKIKQANTLDLVVLAAEWGHGRRSGWLSNLHLGARDPASGDFVMLGKTFKGMTDEMLAWQTTEFPKHETHRDGWTVYLRPEIVVEIAFNEVQKSSQYPGGFALRFARVKGFRPDKRPAEADTIDTVRRIYSAQVHSEAEDATGRR